MDEQTDGWVDEIDEWVHIHKYIYLNTINDDTQVHILTFLMMMIDLISQLTVNWFSMNLSSNALHESPDLTASSCSLYSLCHAACW